MYIHSDCSPILVNPANDEDIHNTSTSDEDQPEFDESAVGTKRYVLHMHYM